MLKEAFLLEAAQEADLRADLQAALNTLQLVVHQARTIGLRVQVQAVTTDATRRVLGASVELAKDVQLQLTVIRSTTLEPAP